MSRSRSASLRPQTGPVAAFGVIAQGLKVQAEKVNAAGGIDGHKVEIVPKDDAYDPNKSPAAVTELIEKDKIAGSIYQVGTPNVAATRSLYEESCTPQMFVGTGFPAFGDPKNHPWTVGGGALGYNTEAVMWGEFIAKNKPGAKIAQLTYNNDFGKSYSTAMEQVAKDKGFTIVESKLHEGTATSLDNEITAILAADPDVVLGETTGKFCPMLMAGLAAGGYKGITLISATCASVAQFWKPVDPAGNGMYIVGLQKDPSDPRFADDPAMKQYMEDVAQYGGGADPKIGSVTSGYNVGAVLVDVLQRAAKLEGGLTRANIMNAVWSTDVASPLAVGGKAHIDGIKDAYPLKFGEMLRYDASKGSQVPTGETFDVEGKTGVYRPAG